MKVQAFVTDSNRRMLCREEKTVCLYYNNHEKHKHYAGRMQRFYFYAWRYVGQQLDVKGLNRK